MEQAGSGSVRCSSLRETRWEGTELVPETVDLVKVDLGPSNSAKVGLKGSYSIHLILKLTFLGAHIGLGFKGSFDFIGSTLRYFPDY